MHTACTKHRTATTSGSSSAGQFCRPRIEKGLACKTITVSEGLDGCGAGLSCRRHSQPRLHSSQSHALFRINFRFLVESDTQQTEMRALFLLAYLATSVAGYDPFRSLKAPAGTNKTHSMILVRKLYYNIQHQVLP